MNALIDLYQAHAFWTWLGLGAALLAIEVAFGSGWLLWPAASAAVTAAVTHFARLDPPLSITLFSVLTIASTLAARRYLPRSAADAPGGDINDNIARLVGAEGRAVADFIDGAGRVFIDGKEWAAALDEGVASDGDRLVVTGISGGSRLQVRRSS